MKKGFLGTLKGFARRRQEEAVGTQPHSIRLRKLRRATHDFDRRNLIGVGGYGNVYLGVLKDGTKVAVKRRNAYSEQGAKEFHVEKEHLSMLNHPNLVSLIGYCEEDGEQILVYEYMEQGSLKSHLYGAAGKPSLSWKQRLEVCVGAAKGLHYLHTSSPNGIIHRDVKTDNILLDENLCAKIGDFGLSRRGPEQNQTHVFTGAMGTFGFVDPHYCEMGMLCMKSDVYSFGVVLLEVLCGRQVIDHTLSAEEEHLVYWGQKMLEEERVESIVDKNLLGTIHQHYLTMFGNIVLKCLAKECKDRPTMEQVLSDLQDELDMCVHAEVKVAAGNSDDISSQPILQGGGNALQRSLGQRNIRYSPVSDHAGSSAPSTSLGGNPMNGGAIELERISEENSAYDSESDSVVGV